MSTSFANTEYRNLPLSILTESKTNPRHIFEDAALKELAASIRSQGVLSPLLVLPLNERSFEIVAGARRYRAAQMGESESRPYRQVGDRPLSTRELAIRDESGTFHVQWASSGLFLNLD